MESFLTIDFDNRQKDLPVSGSSFVKVMHACLKKLGIKKACLTFHLVTKKKIGSLHARFFNDPSVTDCITFPLESAPGEENTLQGEIFICPWQAKEYVEKKAFDVYEELTLYAVHGLLHLLGFDDLTPVERQQMKRQEKRLMSYLKKNNQLVSPPRKFRTPA